nr:hypothetical protein [uncultured Cohaesibacter sp.]
MKRMNQTGHSMLELFLGLCFSFLLGFIPLNSAQAQTSAAPLDLGTVMQNSAPRQAPSYLKLPETLPLPSPSPLKSGAEQSPSEAATTPPAPGQIAPGSSSESTEQLEATETASPAESPLDANAPSVEDALTQPTIEPSVPEAPEEPEIQPGGIAHLQLFALLSDEGQILQRGMNWRIFSNEKDKDGHLRMLHNVDGGTLDIDLEPGSYVVYAGYGYANLTKRVVLPRAGDYSESFSMHAGAMRLNAVATGDVALDNNILNFDIYTSGDTDAASHSMLVKNVKPNHVVRLSEGTYHVVSNYGSANARVRGDVEITEGKLINVTMIHNAAKITLRLVSEPGGEALANTIWTVFTPGGDVVKRAIGAFPTLALAAGDYTAIAKQGNEVYNRDFSVTPGLNREIEVLASAQ